MVVFAVPDKHSKRTILPDFDHNAFPESTTCTSLFSYPPFVFPDRISKNVMHQAAKDSEKSSVALPLNLADNLHMNCASVWVRVWTKRKNG